MALTLKQRKFVEAYLGKANGNATEAARLAGYKGNDVTLGAVGHETKNKPLVASILKDGQKYLAEIADNSDSATVHRLKAIDVWERYFGPTPEYLPGLREAVERSRRVEIVYLIHCGDTDYYKIGYTSMETESRLKSLQTGSPFKLSVVNEFEHSNAKQLEVAAHQRFSAYRGEGEWFCFTVEQLTEVVDFLRRGIE